MKRVQIQIIIHHHLLHSSFILPKLWSKYFLALLPASKLTFPHLPSRDCVSGRISEQFLQDYFRHPQTIGFCGILILSLHPKAKLDLSASIFALLLFPLSLKISSFFHSILFLYAF